MLVGEHAERVQDEAPHQLRHDLEMDAGGQHLPRQVQAVLLQ